MPPKPTSKILLALDSSDGKGVERKDPSVAEAGRMPRVYLPPIFSPVLYRVG